jgi:hypothetical protein
VPQTNVLFTANQGRTWHSSGESAKPVILDLLVRPRQSRHILRNAVARFRCILYNRRVSRLGVIFCRCQHKQDKKLLSAHDIWDTRFCLASLPPYSFGIAPSHTHEVCVEEFLTKSAHAIPALHEFCERHPTKSSIIGPSMT